MPRSSVWLQAVLAAAMGLSWAAPASSQWTNRYPKVQGYSHHVYLEGYELPVLTNGPIDAVEAPDGERIAFASRGWIWVMDLATGVARRVTSGAEMDSRPAWSPRGARLAFVRDNDHDTRIVVIDAVSGEELTTVDTPAIDLDPAFSLDGTSLYYSSGQAGDLDIWRMSFRTGESVRITTDPGLELKPRPHPNGTDMLLLRKGGGDRVELRRLEGDGGNVVVAVGDILSMTRPALGPDGVTVAINWPTQSGWELRLHDLRQPRTFILLKQGGLPLTPAWSRDGRWIYFSEADSDEVMRLKRIRAAGGAEETVTVQAWDWGTQVARLRIRTRVAGRGGLQPARLNVIDESGHPAVPDRTAPHFDGRGGRVYFYSSGTIEVPVPAGQVRISAVQGLATPEVTRTIMAAAGSVTEVDLQLTSVWNAREAGWASGDHHFHLNYGGQYDLHPSDLVPMMRGEALDMATPLLANLHNRFEDQDLWGWQKSDASPFIRFGQEIRSHFLGHMGLIEIPEFHWPWVWGPGYQVYGSDDRTNGQVLDYAHSLGGLGYYVHPVSSGDPFDQENPANVPVELVADAVLGDVDALEVVCLWSSAEATSALWHRFLSLGVPVAPSGGTDVMTNLYRTMAVGTTRVYAWTGEDLNWPAYVNALQDGRSFVTNGPFLDLRVGDSRPGDAVPGGSASWTIDLASATPVEGVELLVNGSVVWSDDGLARPGTRSYSGSLSLPAGGWIAARARGGESRWPSMDGAPFAHTGAIWIDHRGSTDPETRRAAATELLWVLDRSRTRLVEGYGEVPIPALLARFDAARARLRQLGGS